MSAKQTPNDFIRSLMGRPVIVRLYSGVDYRGVLGAIDGFMNVALEQTDEYIDGTFRKKYGDCYIRGNNAFLFWCIIKKTITSKMIYNFN